MNKYLVKALVTRQGQSGSIRFVPFEVFDLWKSYMQNHHGYRVSAVQVSLWIEYVQDGKPGSSTGGSPQQETVVRLTLKKKLGGVELPVERYFPREDLERVLPAFLAHYGIRPGDAGSMAGVEMVSGLFLQPEEVFADEA